MSARPGRQTWQGEGPGRGRRPGAAGVCEGAAGPPEGAWTPVWDPEPQRGTLLSRVVPGPQYETLNPNVGPCSPKCCPKPQCGTLFPKVLPCTPECCPKPHCGFCGSGLRVSASFTLGWFLQRSTQQFTFLVFFLSCLLWPHSNKPRGGSCCTGCGTCSRRALLLQLPCLWDTCPHRISVNPV